MVITESRLAAARQEALEYLEYSIYMMTVFLGIDPLAIDDLWVQRVEKELDGDTSESDETTALRCLLAQVKSYAKIAPLQ